MLYQQYIEIVSDKRFENLVSKEQEFRYMMSSIGYPMEWVKKKF